MKKQEIIHELLEKIPCVCYLKDNIACETCAKVSILLKRFLDLNCELPLNYDPSK